MAEIQADGQNEAVEDMEIDKPNDAEEAEAKTEKPNE